MAYGEVDELNSLLGVARAFLDGGELDRDLARLQRELFVLGADLATPPCATARIERIVPGHAEALEAMIDRYQAGLPALTSFVLPGGTRAGAFLHLARTVCRRAERAVLGVPRTEDAASDDPPADLVYLNRLSDLLFVMARFANHDAAGGPREELWDGSGG